MSYKVELRQAIEEEKVREHLRRLALIRLTPRLRLHTWRCSGRLSRCQASSLKIGRYQASSRGDQEARDALVTHTAAQDVILFLYNTQADKKKKAEKLEQRSKALDERCAVAMEHMQRIEANEPLLRE